ncbi:LysR family transcriptional regulator [Oxalicibacterium flavum]|uniref:LysR family transcriptional regulator n=1 Tax=Oxalicibacterium flavum TaxID=179467 RepID=A0A8J2UKA1_9BURK|nr:LysR family transcriptional regulator [Oxalicibacterium flavum]GGC02846.1 LysR family transcriptional regulator [Oxalicibacterium flavum]
MNQKKHEALWGHIHSLVVLEEVGSYTAAATRLGISKSAVSQRVSELEKVVGMSLVQRTTRSVRLTEAGQRLVDSSRDYFEGIERNFVQLRDSLRDPRGIVRVTAPVALARQQIVPRLADFLRRYPDIRIELELSDQIVALAKEGFDLAIRHSETVPDTHIAWTLCKTDAVLVATKRYLIERGNPHTPEALSNHDCLHYFRRGQIPVWSFQKEGRNANRINVPINGPLATNNSEALREAALGDLGIALVPDFSAEKDLREGRLVRVLPNWRSVGAFGGKLHAVRPYSPYISKPVRIFVDYLREQLRNGFANKSPT